MNKKSNRFSPEVRERAVRMVHEHRGDYPSYAGPRIAVLTWPVVQAGALRPKRRLAHKQQLL